MIFFGGGGGGAGAGGGWNKKQESSRRDNMTQGSFKEWKMKGVSQSKEGAVSF